jgi:hypothetical protein
VQEVLFVAAPGAGAAWNPAVTIQGEVEVVVDDVPEVSFPAGDHLQTDGRTRPSGG